MSDHLDIKLITQADELSITCEYFDNTVLYGGLDTWNIFENTKCE